MRSQEKSVRAPLLYTAQDVARFCEVDLKTIHHWADAGKIAHHRTEGRHLRFRHVPLVRFLRSHGYPLHEALVTARPTVFFVASDRWPEHPEIVKKLAARFFVRQPTSAIDALARLVADEPDAIVCAATDPTWTRAAIVAIKANVETSWPIITAVSEEETLDVEAWTSTVDLLIPRAELSRLPAELAKSLGLE